MSAIVVRLPDRPFPNGWETRPNLDDHGHTWESVYTESRPGHFVEVDRCVTCHCPRCDTHDGYPEGRCVERRHHSEVHIFEGRGTFAPVGGYLSEEADR